jgi:hypothetical protein
VVLVIVKPSADISVTTLPPGTGPACTQFVSPLWTGCGGSWPGNAILIKPVIEITKERSLATIAGLRDVVRNPGDHQARYPSHDTSIAELQKKVNCRRNSAHAAGVAALSPGDRIECGVDGIGTLRVSIGEPT